MMVPTDWVSSAIVLTLTYLTYEEEKILLTRLLVGGFWCEETSWEGVYNLHKKENIFETCNHTLGCSKDILSAAIS